MQNSSPNQMLMLLTRIGKDSKMVITGDPNQSDCSKQNGLSDFTSRASGYKDVNGVKIIEMNETDIQRSNIVSIILHMYKNENIPQHLKDKSQVFPNNLEKSNTSNISITVVQEIISTNSNDDAANEHLHTQNTSMYLY